MPMPVVHQFAYGVVNPLIAFAMALVGSIFGLICTARVRHAASRRQRFRWLLVASAALGGAGGWLAHMMAMLGLDIPSSPMRYDIAETGLSLVLGVAIVAIALVIVGFGQPSTGRVLLGGLCLGTALQVMHYVGLAATRMHGGFSFDPRYVAGSALIAVVGSTITLALTVATKHDRAVVVGAVVFAITVLAVHYSSMAGARVHVTAGPDNLTGISPETLILPIVIIAILALLGMLFAGLNLGADEQFAGPIKREPVRVPTDQTSPIQISWVPDAPPHYRDDPTSLAAYERAYADSRWRHDGTGQ
jgi:NO-binding membrane sensor protein with MHYT domain